LITPQWDHFIQVLKSTRIGTKYFKGIFTPVLKKFHFELKEWISGWVEIRLCI
jgi:hypothetical protein